jgi:RNA recognition motif-containing protein
MNIYVAQLDAQMKDEDLKSIFAPYGNVASASVEIDAFTDKSRGFGYVDMPDEEQAKAAISSLHQKEINGHQIIVQEAVAKEIKRGSYKVGTGGVNPYRFKKN